MLGFGTAAEATRRRLRRQRGHFFVRGRRAPSVPWS